MTHKTFKQKYINDDVLDVTCLVTINSNTDFDNHARVSFTLLNHLYMPAKFWEMVAHQN